MTKKSKQRRNYAKVALIILTGLSLLLAAFLIVSEAMSLTVGVDSRSPEACRVGAGVWTGSSGVIASAIGVCLIWQTNLTDKPALTIGYFVACIGSVLIDSALVAMQSLCAAQDNLFPFPVFLIALAIAHGACAVVSSTLVWRKWESDKHVEDRVKPSVILGGHTIIIPDIVESYPQYIERCIAY